jgi:hypothetical protein
MERLRNSYESWMRDRPTLAIADFRNKTDKPGLNKQPFFDEMETALFRMDRFDLIDHRETERLLREAGYQQSDLFDETEAVKMGKAVRARYILWGDVSVDHDATGAGDMVKQYRLSLKITDVETHRIVYRDVARAKRKIVR